MNRPLLSDFLKQYPKCPICLDHVPEIRRTKITKYAPHEWVDLRCVQGHYELNVSNAFEGDNIDDIYVHVIHFTTAHYDISICIPDDWIRVSYGFKDEAERIMRCDDYNKWMLTHEQMMDKLNKLWTLA